jgi:hypothetical protein
VIGETFALPIQCIRFAHALHRSSRQRCHLPAHSAYLMLESDPTLAVRDFTEQMECLARQLADYQQQKRLQGKQRLNAKQQERFLR